MGQSNEALCKALEELREAMGEIQFPQSQTIDGLELRLTCPAMPEQYDVYDGQKQVAYFRLRHGEFRVEVPRCLGQTVYRAQPKGDGMFDDDERQHYLTEAVASVRQHYAGSGQ